MGRRLVFMRGLLLGKTVTIAAWVSRCSQRSHGGPDTCQRLDGRNAGEDGGEEGILPERSEWFRSRPFLSPLASFLGPQAQ
jgi:hypothetical protein